VELVLQIPDSIAEAMASRGDLSRRALEAIAIEGYREGTLTQHQVGELLGLARIETEDFLARHVDLYDYAPEDLDREVEVLEELSRRSEAEPPST
jgi:predicted HTH domain antitoxin